MSRELGSDYKSYNLDHLGLVSTMFEELGVGELIDKVIPQDTNKRIVTVGQSVKAMVLNGLGFVNKALYLVPHFFEDKPVGRLVGEGIEAGHLNDDTLGRALDDLYNYGVTKLYSLISVQAVKRLGLLCKFGHLDATGFHTDGTYNSKSESEEGVVQITRGYSRDHRPDLNQVVLQLISDGQAGIPLLMETLNGNNSDKDSFRNTIKTHIGQLREDVGLEYMVADSALYTAETLQEMKDYYWISRVPGTISLTEELIQATVDNLMLTPDERSYCALGVTYAGIKQRWLIIYSPEACDRASKTISKQCLEQSTFDIKEFDKLCRHEFACFADAEKALHAFEKKLTITMVTNKSIDKIPCSKKTKRPTKKQTPDFFIYKISGALASIPKEYEKRIKQKSCFILASNQLDENALSDDEFIKAYKNQQKVERGFRFLKDPMFLASSLYLKSPQRVMALMMIMTLSLLVYSALEYRTRESLVNLEQTFPDQKNKPVKNPTSRWVFQSFTGIHILVIDQIKTIVLNLKEHHITLLQALGTNYQKIYSNSL
jgi:transposase